VSAYIPTNVISITDGQIFLETDLFHSGVRPAINVGISVSRVGGSAQVRSMRSVSGTLRLDLAQYRELAAFAQFGSDLDKVTQAQLNRGKRLVEILKQGQYQPLRIGLQTVSIFAGTKGFLDNLAVAAVRPFEAALHQYLSDEHAQLLDRLETAPKFDEAIEGDLRKAIGEFKDQYVKDNANVLAA
jgi:F-type H+/Na+-transporting ATPase subunit alpha